MRDRDGGARSQVNRYGRAERDVVGHAWTVDPAVVPVHRAEVRAGAADVPCRTLLWARRESPGGRIPEGGVHDGLVEAIAPRGVEVVVAEAGPFAVQPAELARRVLRGRCDPVHRAVAVQLDEGPVVARLLIGREHRCERADVARSVRMGFGELLLVLQQPLLVGFLLADLHGVSELLDEAHVDPPLRADATRTDPGLTTGPIVAGRPDRNTPSPFGCCLAPE